VSDSPWTNRLNDLGEFARRSGRNLARIPGDLAGYAGDFAQNTTNAAIGMAEPNMALWRGDDADQPLFPTAESGGKSRAGAVASALVPDMVPGVAGLAPPGSLGTFAGRLSGTANKKLYNQATKAEARGMPMEEIRQKTGWQRGHDGEWKYEVSDHKAEIRTDPTTGKEILHHPELRRAYPDIIDNLKIERFDGPAENMGRFDPDTNTMYLNRQLTDPHAALSVALHEIQHPIQIKENFSTGASTGMAPVHRITDMEGDAMRERHYRTVDGYHDDFQNWMAPLLNRPKYAKWGLARFQDEFDRLNPDLLAERDAAMDVLGWMDTPHGRSKRVFDTYERAMGEYEARETQHRMDFTPDERKAVPPYSHGKAIPPERLIDMRMFPGENGIPITSMDPANIEIGKGMGTLSPETKALIISILGLGVTNKTAE
jgi:hypothetical protein